MIFEKSIENPDLDAHTSGELISSKNSGNCLQFFVRVAFYEGR